MDAQLIAAELGVVAGLVGAYVHRRGRMRAWLPHLIMGTAMAAMALPDRDPLGPAGWMLVLGCAAAWSLGRPGRGRMRAAVALDLYVMGVLTLLMPAVHGGGGGHTGHGSGAGWWHGPYAGVLVVWLIARLALAVVDQRRSATGVVAADAPVTAAVKPAVSSACSTVMIAAMGVMAFAS